MNPRNHNRTFRIGAEAREIPGYHAMNRHYPPHSRYSTTTDDASADTIVLDRSRGTGYDTGYAPWADQDAYADYGDADYAPDEPAVLPVDRRWMWVAGGAAAVLLVAVVCSVVILGGGDSGAVSAPVTSTSAAPTAAAAEEPPRRTVYATPATPAPPPVPAPSQELAPETITTVTPAPSAPAVPPPAPVEAAPPPAPQGDPQRTVTYRVTGNKPLLDLVTVIYTDHQGALQTEVNVALPWSKTVVLDPGVGLASVTATSVNSQLNCAVTDGTGATLAAQNNNAIIATCTR